MSFPETLDLSHRDLTDLLHAYHRVQERDNQYSIFLKRFYKGKTTYLSLLLRVFFILEGRSKLFGLPLVTVE